MNKIFLLYDNILPVSGGMFGAVKASPITIYPHQVVEAVLYTIAYAIIGAVIGYITKLWLDKFFKRTCNE